MSDMSFVVGPSPSGDMMKDSVISILRGSFMEFPLCKLEEKRQHMFDHSLIFAVGIFFSSMFLSVAGPKGNKCVYIYNIII